MDGSHSLFGLIWQIATATGWTVDYILWHVTYPALMMMMSDAPQWVDGDAKKTSKPTLTGKPTRQSNTAEMFAEKLKSIKK